MPLNELRTWTEILELIFQTALITMIPLILAYLIGLPTGVLLNVTAKRGIYPNKVINTIFSTIVNILRSVPCLIIIVICMPWTRAWFGRGTGEWYTLIIPMTVAAYGFTARMVEQSLNEVPAGELEAVKALGASKWQLITKVLIPESKASLVNGVSVVCVSIVGYTSFANFIGAGGLVDSIYRFYTRHTGDYLESPYFWILIILVIVIVQCIQEFGIYLAKKIDKRRIIK